MAERNEARDDDLIHKGVVLQYISGKELYDRISNVQPKGFASNVVNGTSHLVRRGDITTLLPWGGLMRSKVEKLPNETLNNKASKPLYGGITGDTPLTGSEYMLVSPDSSARVTYNTATYPKKEPTVANNEIVSLTIDTVTYVTTPQTGRVDVRSLSAGTLADTIHRIEGEIKHLEALEHRPLRVTKHLEKLRIGLKDLVKAVDDADSLPEK